jgi:hypothetical protein
MRMNLAFFAGALAVYACSGSSGPGGAIRTGPEDVSVLRITTDRSEYEAGSSVLVTFANVSSDALRLSRCYGVLERETGSGWATAAPAAAFCHDILEGLGPGRSTTNSLRLPAALASGEYRYRFTSAYDASEILLPEPDRLSNTFAVR